MARLYGLRRPRHPKNRIAITANDVQKVDTSPGAALVDPLAALGQSLILKVVEEALTTTIPAAADHQQGEATLAIRIQGIRGLDDAITINGVVKAK